MVAGAHVGKGPPFPKVRSSIHLEEVVSRLLLANNIEFDDYQAR
jgi:hypothetical protein